jgi:putative hydrolase of the HAD superfamily
MEITKRELRVLAFDWGDTLMKVFPMPPGPMVDWPEVAAVEGALECLQALHGRYRIVVATNASESSAQEVRGALDRVGLGEFIDEIFTVKEIGTSKLSPVYYSQLEIILGERREHLMMVGDHYTADVLHPWQAGWQAAWFNPAGLAAPGLLPVQSIDLARLADLPEALSSISLPGYMDCLAWYLAREAPQIQSPNFLL